MGLSGDQTPPSPPSFGDESDIFAVSDTLPLSAGQRVVDTQSGFLIVVRSAGPVTQISFRRQLGTPPKTSVDLTPDETVKLAHILSDHAFRLPSPKLRRGRRTNRDRDYNSRPAAQVTRTYWMPVLIAACLAFLAGSVTGYLVGLKAPPRQQAKPIAAPSMSTSTSPAVADLPGTRD